MSRTYVKEFVPVSWFHPKGVFRVVSRFKHRLPNVSRCLFATFTIDRQAMRSLGYGPAEAFEITRDRIRKMFYKLRKGVRWNGKVYRIDAEYCTKVEFHDDEEGWPHYHVIWLTRRFVPVELLEELWGYGFVNLRRIKNERFHYLLKYVCKSGEVPEWIHSRKRIRIFQPSRGFMLPEEKPLPRTAPASARKPRPVSTIGERLSKWAKLAVVVTEYGDGSFKRFSELPLWAPFNDIFDHLVYTVALSGRYLGGGKIQINTTEDLYPWIQKQNLPLPILRKAEFT